MPRDMFAGWGEEIMAIEPSAMRGFDRSRSARKRGERADVGGTTVEWDDDGLARMGGVALVQIEGPLARSGGWWNQGYDDILEAHDKAFRSDARAVLQVVHSPGGYVSGLDETAMALEEMARQAGKPLWSLSADMGYSAVMRLMFAAQKRFVTRAGGVGSIGIIVTRSDWTKANEMMGITYHQIASGRFKTDGDPDTAASKEELARIRERVMHHAGLFFDAASRATGLSVAEVQAQEAGLYLGQAAVEAKLCDGVSTLAAVVAQLEQLTSSGRATVAVPAGPRGQQATKGRSMENTVLAMALGKVSPTASDQELTERMTALRGLEDKIRETTGKSDPGAALAVIEGWREGAAKLTEAQGELAKVRDREEKTAYAALVSQGELSAQITPGNRAKVLERFPTSSSLSAYLETAPAALPGRATAAETQPKAPEGKPAEGGALTYQGKAWKDLKPAEQAALYQADRPLYDSMRGAAMAQKGDAR